MHNVGASSPVKDRKSRINIVRAWTTTLLSRTRDWRHVGNRALRRSKYANIGREGQMEDYGVDEESCLNDESSHPPTPCLEPRVNEAKVMDELNPSLAQDGGTVSIYRENSSYPSPSVAYVALMLNGLGVIQAGYGPGNCAEVKSIVKQLVLNPSEPILLGNRYMTTAGGHTVHLLVNRKNRYLSK